nr:YggS family pyridoxal phosphate enzyme [Desertimonas flava]
MKERVEAIRRRLAASGRDIELVAVTKGFPVDAIRAAVAAGCPMVGENYAQEVVAKFSELRRAAEAGDGSSEPPVCHGAEPPLLSSGGPRAAEPPLLSSGGPRGAEPPLLSSGGPRGAEPPLLSSGGPRGAEPPVCHFIGRLQSNKVRQLAPYVAVWESVDRSSLLAEIAKRAPGATVLIQVNATGEDGKGGCTPDEAPRLADEARRLDLDLDGMMTVGPTSGDPAETAAAFTVVRRLVDSMHLRTCSMGMSGDIDQAFELGTTRVRIGSAIFGSRT